MRCRNSIFLFYIILTSCYTTTGAGSGVQTPLPVKLNPPETYKAGKGEQEFKLLCFGLGGGLHNISSTYNDFAYYLYQGWYPAFYGHEQTSPITSIGFPLEICELFGSYHAFVSASDRIEDFRFKDVVTTLGISIGFDWKHLALRFGGNVPFAISQEKSYETESFTPMLSVGAYYKWS